MSAADYRLLADLVLLLHLAFVMFVVVGALLVMRWRWLAWLHLPAVAWGVFVEFSGRICPLTPLENRFRLLAGEGGYSGGFVEHYILPLLYPPGLTFAMQWMIGGFVLVLNLSLYGWMLWRRRGIFS